MVLCLAFALAVTGLAFVVDFVGKFFVPKSVKDCHAYFVANRTWVDSVEEFRTDFRSHRGWIGLAEVGRPARLVHEREGRVDTFNGTIKPDYGFGLGPQLRFRPSSFQAIIGSYWLLSADDSAWLMHTAKQAVWCERARVLADSFDVRELRRQPATSAVVVRIGGDLLVYNSMASEGILALMDHCGRSPYHHVIGLADGWSVVRNVDCQE